MLGDRMHDELLDQLNAELYSAYLYLAMSAYFEEQGLTGFANWMRVQAQEELSHALKFYDFVVERGRRAVLKAIEAPPAQWDSPLAVFENVAEHERKVTAAIHKLVDVAAEERDHATSAFLQWFVREQVEEEASADQIVHRLRLVGDSPQGLLALDTQLSRRSPAAGAEEAPEQ